MRKHITIEQWRELSTKEKWAWLYFLAPKNVLPYYYDGSTIKKIEWEMECVPYSDAIANLPGVAQMIEFLGNKWWEKYGKVDLDFDILCDQLWESVKCKINKC